MNKSISGIISNSCPFLIFEISLRIGQEILGLILNLFQQEQRSFKYNLKSNCLKTLSLWPKGQKIIKQRWTKSSNMPDKLNKHKNSVRMKLSKQIMFSWWNIQAFASREVDKQTNECIIIHHTHIDLTKISFFGFFFSGGQLVFTHEYGLLLCNTFAQVGS